MVVAVLIVSVDTVAAVDSAIATTEPDPFLTRSDKNGQAVVEFVVAAVFAVISEVILIFITYTS